ncbi:AAA family ATPase [Streptomyces sp. NPDC002793]|uniref:AAA family ATPase n=1 Tax=Streptomyces sp. NPDC002793 TaxID=3154432 RepID=UPI00332FFD16
MTGNAYSRSVHQQGDNNSAVVNHHYHAALPPGRAHVVGRMPAVGRWIDRENEVRELLARLDPGRGAPGPVVVHGPAGVGKTFLVRAVAQEARRSRRRWFSGELFIGVDNRPGDADTVTDVLGQALRLLAPALSKPVPPSVSHAEQRELFGRFLLEHADQHGKPTLIVVDGATGADQVASLLPPGDTGRLLVTSRSQLAELLHEHASFHVVDRLAPSDAVALLDSVVTHALGGDRRVADDLEMAHEVAEFCDRLPFALMRAAQLLVAGPGMSVAGLRDRLTDVSRRLTELGAGDQGIRSTLGASHQLLQEQARELLRLLPLHPGPHIGAHAAGALAGISPLRADECLRALHDLRFLERSTGYDGYRFESLVLLYARERGQEVAADEQVAALRRLLEHYLVTARIAVARLLDERPSAGVSAQLRALAPHSAARATTGFATPDDALAWLDAERPSLVAAVVHTHDHPSLPDHAVDLTLSLTPFLDLRNHWDDWVLTHRQAALSAQRSGDWAAESLLLRETGRAYHQQGRLDEALACYREAIEAWGATDRSTPVEAVSLMYRVLSELDDPLESDHHVAALESVLSTVEQRLGTSADSEVAFGDGVYDPSLPRSLRPVTRRAIAAVLNNLGVADARRGDLSQALIRHERAARHSHQARDRQGEAESLLHLGNIHLHRGDLPGAQECYLRAYRDFSAADEFGRGQAAYNLGLAHASAGEAREVRRWMDIAAGHFATIDSDAARRLEGQLQEVRRLTRPRVGRRDALRRIPLLPLSPLVVLPPLAALRLEDLLPDTHPGLVLLDSLPDANAAFHGLVDPAVPDDETLAALPIGSSAGPGAPVGSRLPIDAAEEEPEPPVELHDTSRSRTRVTGGGHYSLPSSDNHSASSTYDSGYSSSSSSSSSDSYDSGYSSSSTYDSSSSSSSDSYDSGSSSSDYD